MQGCADVAKVQADQLPVGQGRAWMELVTCCHRQPPQGFSAHGWFGLFPSLNHSFQELPHNLTQLATHLLNLFLARFFFF